MALIGDPIYQYFSMGFRGQPSQGRPWILQLACPDVPQVKGTAAMFFCSYDSVCKKTCKVDFQVLGLGSLCRASGTHTPEPKFEAVHGDWSKFPIIRRPIFGFPF